MVCVVQRLAFGGQQLHGLAYASGLVYGALLADGQVHGQVQKGVGLTGFHGIQGGERSVHIRQDSMVFGVFVYPLASYDFYSFTWRAFERFGINGAKKTANIRLAGLLEHGEGNWGN
jgi:hypothetical protein